MHEINDRAGVTEGWKVDFLRLPSGEFVKPALIDAIRVITDKADRATGEIGSRVGIDHKGSWFMVRFQHERDAKRFAEALAELCNKVARGEHMADEPRPSASMSRRDARDLIAGIAGRPPEGDEDDEASDESQGAPS